MVKMNLISVKKGLSARQSLGKSLQASPRILDQETIEMLQHATSLGINTIFHRQANTLSSSIQTEKRCHYGSLGLCCKQCAMGPCRIRQQDGQDYLINDENNRGLCGADADTIAARNLLMMIARGTSAHASHAKYIAQILLNLARHETQFDLKDPQKLKAIYNKIKLNGDKSKEDLEYIVDQNALSDIPGNKKYMKSATSYLPQKLKAIYNKIKLNGDKSIEDLEYIVGQHALSDILENNKYMKFASSYLPLDKTLFDLGVIPKSVGHELLESGHETSMGTMSDPTSIILHAARLGLADITSLIISSELQDAVFGIPKPVSSRIGINVLDVKKVNLVIHGHAQFLSEKIIELSEDKKLLDKAKRLGAEGINIVGCCCSGNELLIRHGIPLASSNLEQELVITTGLVEAFILDVQCIFPSIEDVAAKFHTKLISTMKEGRFRNAEHIPFEEEHADEIARKILDIAIENFPNRGDDIFLPDSEPRELMAGFSVESCLDTLSRLNPHDPLKALTDEIRLGNIKGIVLLCGCTSSRSTSKHAALARELMAQNVLIVSTGCAAQACARAGLLSPDATNIFAGNKLRNVLEALGKASGLDAPLPPVWHFGSCVDNSRIIILISAIAQKLAVNIKDLPIVSSAAEWVTEKASAIGTGAVALGVTVHLGTAPPILGSKEVVSLVTEKAEQIFGGKFIVEQDPVFASELILEHIQKKREKLGLVI